MAIPDIIYVGGGKGGVGKNATLDMLVDYMTRNGKQPLIVDSDNSNLDAYQRYEGKLPTKRVHLGERDGWAELFDIMQENGDKPIVINAKAGNNDSLDKGAASLQIALDKLGKKLTALWVINRDDSSWVLLPHLLKVLPTSDVHVVINTHWGDVKKFELWQLSGERERLLERNGKEIVIPDVADRITYKMKNDPWYTYQEAYEKLPFSSQIEIDRIRAEVSTEFEKIFR
jgi:hypothetical protein